MPIIKITSVHLSILLFSVNIANSVFTLKMITRVHIKYLAFIYLENDCSVAALITHLRGRGLQTLMLNNKIIVQIIYTRLYSEYILHRV